MLNQSVKRSSREPGRESGCGPIQPLGYGKLMAVAAMGAIWAASLAHGATAAVTQTLSAQLAAIGKVSVPISITLTNTGTVFNPYSGSLTVNYRARSTTIGTGGSITLQSTAEFTPSGGPTVGSGTLTYGCSGPTLGTACSGTLTVSLVSATNVLTIPASVCTGGGGSCSSANPNTENINFSLVDDPGYKTGTYSASITFTISST